MASSSLVVASPAQPRRRNQPLALPTSTTPALHVTRLVEAKTRFCQFCGNRFCGVFRPKRVCDGCGGVVCDGCSSKMEATRGNQPLRVCPGCDVRLKACPNFIDHMVARQEYGEGIYHNVTMVSSQTPPPASPSSSSSSSTVSPASTPSPPSVGCSSIATQTWPCVVFAPSSSCQAPTSVDGYTIRMTMRPHFTPEPRPSVSPLAWLLRAIGNADNDNNSTNNIRSSGSISNSSTSTSSNSSNNIRSSSSVSSSSRNNIAVRTRSSTSTSTSTSPTNSNSTTNSNSSNNNGANQQDNTFAFQMDQGEEFLRTKVATITQGILRHRYGVTGVAAVVVGVSGLAAFLGCSRSRR